MFAGDARHIGGHALSGEVRGEQSHRLPVALDRARGEVGGAEVAPPGDGQLADVPYNGRRDGPVRHGSR